MNADLLHAECVRLQKMMSEKGYVLPRATLYVNWLWDNQITSCVEYRTSKDGKALSLFTHVNIEDGWSGLIENTEKAIEKLPSVLDKKLDEFIAAVGKLIDQGRDIGIEVDFLNPLTEMMKSLSYNIITKQTF